MASDDETLGPGTGCRKTPQKTLPSFSVQGLFFKLQFVPIISAGQDCPCMMFCVDTSLKYLPLWTVALPEDMAFDPMYFTISRESETQRH